MFKIIATAIALISLPVMAAPAPFTGTDYSGTYQCTGHDSHIGDFAGTVNLKLDPRQSSAGHGAYTFTLTLTDHSVYDGFAAATGPSMALYFAHQNPALKDYGVGIAAFEKVENNKYRFSKYYYGPQFEGGAHGMEQCVQP